MRETIYLIISRQGVQGTRKSAVDVKRGEILAKLNISVPEGAFKPPVVEQNVDIVDWREGIELEDVEFKNPVISAAEAETLRAARIARAKAMLEGQGFTVTKAENEDSEQES